MSEAALGERVRDTLRLLDARARRYRNLVIAVTAAGAVSVIAGVVLGSWKPLAAAPVLMTALTGLHHVRDARLVGRWQAGLLDAWTRGELDLTRFLETLVRTGGIPPRTLAGMIGSLPRAAGEERAAGRMRAAGEERAPGEERKAGEKREAPGEKRAPGDPERRRAATARHRDVQRQIEGRIAGSFAALTVVLALVALALVVGSPLPLAALPVPVAVLFLFRR